MKTFMSIIFFTAMLLTSCGISQSKEEKEESTNETDLILDQSAETSDLKEAKNCDEFIDQYEEWMDNYIILIDKYLKNPMDATLSQDYMKQAQKGIVWMNQWNSKLTYCASKEKYQKRFDEISEKAEKKLKEMGIE
ncbi:MAG: hypothetical protein KAU83_11745 [Bacteroidales bacterium]|nr:hypothetical protein [Bacteroidales bacterium]